MIEPRKLAETLQDLSKALESGTLAEIGELYRTAEVLSIGIVPAKASKPFLQQVMRKHLIREFGGLMSIGSSMTHRSAASYDVQAELASVVDELKEYHR